MAGIKLNTSVKAVPMIYAYTTPEIRRHDGWTKIGYTEQDVATRINQQTHTADVEWHEEWRGKAEFDDGSGDIFTDKAFHAYLQKNNVERDQGKDNEWFKINGIDSKRMFYDFRENCGNIASTESTVIAYNLRDEQEEAVSKALDYFKLHENGAFLWNAKPRFGKTLAAYDLCKRLNASRVLIVTNRPAIANSWYSDYATFLGTESGYTFVSNVDGIKDRQLVKSREKYIADNRLKDDWDKCIEFVSLQDLKGSKYFGGNFDKLREVKDLTWDILIIDEAHEGASTYKADVAFEHIKRNATLHLSGTPFKMLANDEFAEDAIYNWTYADEQKKKREFVTEPGTDNPYAKLPQLNMFTYQMSEIIKDELEQGKEIDGETVEYAFDLNEFFMCNEKGRFIHNEAVNQFLDALTTQEKFPFSTDELRNELKHTVWLLNRVDSAKALAQKLKNHPIFKDYEVIVAAGDGRLTEDDEKETEKAYDRVTKAIKQYDKTITLTVGQLTTGITIPEWTAVLMLSSIQSAALYMQAAFRAQNPCLFTNGKECLRKQNAYIFDFDPARTLIIFEKFANDLNENTANGKGDSDTRKENVRELLNFFPVIGEDENGSMVELDAEKVLSIPRKIKSQEVVKRGFMSNFLFQNISNVFNAPQEVLDIITAIDPAKEPPKMTTESKEDLSLNKEGEVELSQEQVIGLSSEIFGDKLYKNIPESFGSMVDDVKSNTTLAEKNKALDDLSNQLTHGFKENITKKIMETADVNYGNDLTKSTRNDLEKRINANAENEIQRAVSDLKIQQNTIEADKEIELDQAKSKEETVAIEKKYEEKHQTLIDDFKKNLTETVEKHIKEAEQEVVKTVETDKREAKKRTIEDDIKDHLRGFSRTIPSFLMAYGNDGNIITLATFDRIVPNEVFKEVTSITLTNFRFLRDGGDYIDPDTKEQKHFEGHLFDPIVFDDSVKEFLNKKKQLADYFDEKTVEDIFDYIPPQKTNQIFTPKWVVKDMVDRLEQENPGCFDDPDKTFVDLYMKSGMYITEIVTRLYQSNHMKQLYPNSADRLNHIFAKQVFGCAPTEIIYHICLSYILGFSDEIKIGKHNIKLCDTLKYAKEGMLREELEKLFPNLT